MTVCSYLEPVGRILPEIQLDRYGCFAMLALLRQRVKRMDLLIVVYET